jgi:acetoacetyl-CoA synthetase
MSELWRPSPARVADANLTRFMQCVNARRGTRLGAYPELYDWSLRSPAEFWSELARFTDVRAEWGTGAAIENPGAMPGARFFPQARLNFAANLLRFADEQPALVFRSERGIRRSLSYRELRAEVGRVAAGLAAAGVVAGDRVAGYLPNLPEAAIAMLATASLGAIWSSCSPDFGVHGVLDRFGQILPKVLFSADGYSYGGKNIDSLGPVEQVLTQLRAVERVVVIPYLQPQPDLGRLGAAAARAVLWEEFGAHGDAPSFTLLPFNHPLYILYSSGTTGVPKCIVHAAGGTLLQHQKEHVLHTDLRRSDRLFYFTTCGWMMWNWLMSALATGATVVLYDGSPFHPDPGTLWRMAEEERLTVFGTSAKYL